MSFTDRNGFECSCRCNQHGDSSRSLRDEADPESPPPESSTPAISPKTLFRPTEVSAPDEDEIDFEAEAEDIGVRDTLPDSSSVKKLEDDDIAQRPVKVTIVFDSMCPFSRYSISTSAWQLIKVLSDDMSAWGTPRGPDTANMWRPLYTDNMILEILPYGNFVPTPSGGVQCQHGPRECDVNLLSSCLLTQLPAKKYAHTRTHLHAYTPACIHTYRHDDLNVCISQGVKRNGVRSLP